MFLASIKRLLDGVSKALRFVRQHGVRLAGSRIKAQLFGRKKQLTYKTLQKKHSAVAPSNTTPTTIAWLEAIAEKNLDQTLSLLKISLPASELLSALKHSASQNVYCQILDDLLTLGKALQNTSSPSRIIQASQLPALPDIRSGRRILFITSQLPSLFHGGGIRVFNFIKALSETNTVYLATAYYPQEDDDLLQKITPYCHSIYTIPYWKFGDNRAELHTWLKGVPIDIVHYEWLDALQNYDPALGQHHIFTYMEAVSLRLFMDLQKLPPLSPPWLATFSRFLSALRAEVAETLPLTARIAVTTKDAEFLQSIYPHQDYAVLNHGVSLDDFSLPDTEPEPKTITFVGNFGHYPNVDAMIWFFTEIWGKILNAEPATKLYLVGPNPPEALTQLADGKQIIVTGGVTDVRPYIQKACFCIAPLISGAGLRGKVIEYAALQRTFVATSIATEDLVYQAGSDYLKADTADEFAEKTIRLLQNGKLGRTMASSAYLATQQNYDTRRLVNFLLRFYTDLDRTQS